jgi:HTH-type transcriptional regulator/antitoxin HigA
MDNEFEPDWASPPGDTIKGILEERGATSDDLARKLSLTRDQMDDLLKGTLPLTERIATDLCSILGGSVQFWINREANYRSDLIRLAKQEEIARLHKRWAELRRRVEAEMGEYWKHCAAFLAIMDELEGK